VILVVAIGFIGVEAANREPAEREAGRVPEIRRRHTRGDGAEMRFLIAALAVTGRGQYLRPNS
jgi:hypothetical protein